MGRRFEDEDFNFSGLYIEEGKRIRYKFWGKFIFGWRWIRRREKISREVGGKLGDSDMIVFEGGGMIIKWMVEVINV